jgi:hypothetical protein
LGAVLVVVVPGLGRLTLEHRSQLLGLSEGALSYSPEKLGLAGLTILWRLPWRMLYALLHGEWQLFVPAWIGALACGWVGWRCRTPCRPAELGALAFLALALALAAPSVRDLLAPRDTGVAAVLGPDLRSQAIFETRSWLLNPSEQNRRRREALAGLEGWLLLLAIAIGWRARQVRARTGFQAGGRRFLVGGSAVLALFFLGQLPRAHAFARWGLEHPRVILVTAACDPELALGLKSGRVAAWDISEGATQEYLLVTGDLYGPLGAFVPLDSRHGGRCSALGGPEVVRSVRREEPTHAAK